MKGISVIVVLTLCSGCNVLTGIDDYGVEREASDALPTIDSQGPDRLETEWITDSGSSDDTALPDTGIASDTAPIPDTTPLPDTKPPTDTTPPPVDTAPTCASVGGTCADYKDCCSKLCDTSTSPWHCTCKGVGPSFSFCYTDAECCSGKCDTVSSFHCI